MIQIYERVQVTEDGRTGTVLESDVLGVVVQYDSTTGPMNKSGYITNKWNN